MNPAISRVQCFFILCETVAAIQIQNNKFIPFLKTLDQSCRVLAIVPDVISTNWAGVN